MPETLLVIISDRLSHIIKKGELIDRYYNPGDLFKHVHILMTNSDRLMLTPCNGLWVKPD